MILKKPARRFLKALEEKYSKFAEELGYDYITLNVADRDLEDEELHLYVLFFQTKAGERHGEPPAIRILSFTPMYTLTIIDMNMSQLVPPREILLEIKLTKENFRQFNRRWGEKNLDRFISARMIPDIDVEFDP